MKRLFFNEEGFSSVGASVALLLVFSLAFAGVQASWADSRSGQVQYVADAGALAADNAVAEFVTLGQAVDAALLSLGLLELGAYAIGAVAAFVPGGQGVAAECIEVGTKIRHVRESAGKSAVKGLGMAQRALPAVCVARAAASIRANADASGAGYYGFAVPVPLAGVEFSLPDTSEVDDAGDVIADEADDVNECAREYEELQKALDSAKLAAWKADCGKSGMNMRERARTLAGMSGARNPNFTSPEVWTFAAALERAKKYYRARYNAEPGSSASGSPELVGESVARKRFYAYALETVSKGEVKTASDGSERPRFEKLARNTGQIRSTRLYTEAVYPVSDVGGKRILHAYAGCPRYAAGIPAGTASVRSIDTGACGKCEVCDYSATTLGRVPSASTSISNGFEYYYREVAEQADAYEAAAERAAKVKKELGSSRHKIMDALDKAFSTLATTRYDPQPPGRYGCVCVVYGSPVQGPSLPFVHGDAKVGTRVAVSGASLAPDPATDQGNVIAQIGSNALPQGSMGSGLLKAVFGAWGKALKAYSDGNDGLVELFNTVFGSAPVVGNDLSDWAVSGFKDVVRKAGLEPAKLQTYKPVVVNTSHIASRDSGTAAKTLLKLKTTAQVYGDVSMGDIRALASTLDAPQELQDLLSEDGLTVFRIPFSRLGLGMADYDIKYAVPSDVLKRASEAIVRVQGG